jgi:predicted permease
MPRAGDTWNKRGGVFVTCCGSRIKKGELMLELLDSVAQDIRYGLRMLLRNRALSTAAALSLAIGIGANSAVFSLVHTLFYSSIPGIADSHSVVGIWESRTGYPDDRFKTSYPMFEQLRADPKAFAGVTAFTTTLLPVGPTVFDTRKCWSSLATPDYFSVLGVKPLRGRLLHQDSEDQSAVISEALWKRLYDGDENVLGSLLYVQGHPFTVVGIVPGNFRGTRLDVQPEVWIPLSAHRLLDPGLTASRNSLGTRWLFIAGRLKTGATALAVQSELNSVVGRLRELHPEFDRSRTLVAISLSEGKIAPALRGIALRFSAVLGAIALLVLGIACANVANLLLARWAGRRGEIGLRLGLGASRCRVLRQLLIESILLALLGGALGLVLACVTQTALRGVRLPTPTPLEINLGPDLSVFVFAFLLSLGTGIAFGVIPAVHASPSGLLQLMRGAAGQVESGRTGGRLRNILTVSQVTFSVLLLLVAGLFVRSLQKAYRVDLGFDARHVLLMTVDASSRTGNDTQLHGFARELQTTLSLLPGVQAVSVAESVPLVGGFSETSVTAGEKLGSPEEGAEPMYYNTVAPGYFSVMSSPVVQGRDFGEIDTPTSFPVVIINRTAATQLWPGHNPIGKRLRLGGSKNPMREVVGVVPDWKYQSVWEGAEPSAFIPLTQNPQRVFAIYIQAANAASLVRPAVEKVRALGGNLPVFDIRTFPEHLDTALFNQKIGSLLLGGFGLLGLLLSTVGIAGVVAYSVSSRTREIGIRLALGARKESVLWLVVRKGLLLSTCGVVLGIGLAVVATRFLAGLLPGISVTDPATFLAIPLLSVFTALAASYIPALRATRITPMEALRYE